MYFLLNMITYFKNLILLGIMSVPIFKKIDGKPAYNKHFLKTKIKSYGDEATDFHNKEIPKEGSNHTCFAAIVVDFDLT